MSFIKRKSLIFLVVLCLISLLFTSCENKMTGKYIPEDQYSSDIVIDSIEFSGDTVHIEAGGESHILQYKIEEEAFILSEDQTIMVDGTELPYVFIYKKLNNSSFILNNIKYVLEDSVRNQDRGMGKEKMSTEELINEYIESDGFQKFIDSYTESVEAAGRVRVDAYASGNNLVIEHKYFKDIPDKSYKKIRKHYIKYLNSLSNDKKKKKKYVKIKKASGIKGMKLKFIVVDKDGNFIAEKNF